MGFGKGDGIVYSHAAMLAYYRQGLSDPEIARKVGCTAAMAPSMAKSRREEEAP